MDTPTFQGLEIIETMPHAGMSIVYKARQISLDRIVVLKTLPLALSAKSVDINQFLAEARITANLKHQNIVQVYDFGKTEEGIYYFVMEFVSGYSVGDWIRRKHFLAEENSLLIAQSVAEALDYAWKTARVVHCDIKPDNVIIDGDGTVKVADLGLAKSIRSVVDRAKLSSGMVFGTPNYISPEQSRGDADLDCRADIYSLGATLYHCLTGKMPFEGVPALAAMDMQITEQIPDAQDINPRLSTEAACLMETMLAKDRQYRQVDWNSVLVDVGRVIGRQMPLGALPPKGASTIQRGTLRGTRLHVKTPAPAPAYVVSGEKSPDSTAFRNMERKFALKQKRKSGIRPEWWFAGLITLAVIVLGILVARSVWFSGPPAGLEGEKRPPPVSQDMSSREDNARGMFEFARKWAQDNPARINDAMQQYKKVAQETKGTKYSLMASAEIQKLQELKQKSVAAVMETLDTRAKPLIAKNQFAKAAALYEQYQGEWTSETASIRAAKINELGERERVFLDRRQKAAQAAVRQWRQLLDQVGARLLEGDVQGALVQATQGAEAPPLVTKKKEINDLVMLLTAASRMDERILNAFRLLKNQEVTVVLTNRVERVTIRDIQGAIIQAEKIIRVGAGQVNQPKPFCVADLAVSEKRLRLGVEDKPEIALMQGLLSVGERDWDSAESFFSKTGPVLSPVLVATLAKKKGSFTEEQARRFLLGMLRYAQIDVPENNPACADCLAAIQNREYSAKDAQALAKAVDTYRANFGQTRIAKQYEPLLVALAHVPMIQLSELEVTPSPVAPPVLPGEAQSTTFPAGRSLAVSTPSKQAAPPASPEAVKAQLLERNPDLIAEDVFFQQDEAGNIFRIEIYSRAIKDIRPLSELKDLREVILCGIPEKKLSRDFGVSIAPLSDLSPLRGMPLGELDLSYTMIKDIAVLVGMPLSKVNLAHTQVTELLCLKGMPLTRLNVAGCRIRDISVLRAMPLNSLVLDDTDIADLIPLQGLQLQMVSIARTRVRDLMPLAGMPLHILDLSGTNIKNLSQLKIFPLKILLLERIKPLDFSFLAELDVVKLSLAETGIRDLSVLKGLPLKELDLSGTRVKDLSPLQDLPLEKLLLNRNMEVRDLAPLKNLPLKMLGIMQTQVRDITPLQDMPIEYIWLDYNMYRPGEKRRFTDVLRRMPMLRQVNGRPLRGGEWRQGDWRRKR